MASSALDNPDWENFCQSIAEGSSGAAAYREHIAKLGTKVNTCMTQASIMLSDPKISQRVSDLRKSFKEVLENKLGVKQETLARHLLSIIETPVGEVTEESPLCQEFTRTRQKVGHGEEAEEWETEKVKTPSKLDAIKELNKMAGYYAPERVEHSGGVALSGLEDAVKQIFGNKP